MIYDDICVLAPKPQLPPSASPVPLPLSPEPPRPSASHSRPVPLPQSPEPPQPPAPKNDGSPAAQVVVPLNPTTDNNSSTAVTGPPQPSSVVAPYSGLSNSGNVTSDSGKRKDNMSRPQIVLAISLLACLL